MFRLLNCIFVHYIWLYSWFSFLFLISIPFNNFYSLMYIVFTIHYISFYRKSLICPQHCIFCFYVLLYNLNCIVQCTLYAHFIFHSRYWRFFFCIFLCVFYALFYPILYCFFVYSVNSLVQSTFAKFASICRVNLIFRRPVRKSLWNWFIPFICGLPNGGANKINF